MAKKSIGVRPRLSRVTFYRAREGEFFDELSAAIDRAIGAGAGRLKQWGRLTPAQQGCFAWPTFTADVQNGGLAQYFYNHADGYVPALGHLLTATDNAPLAALLEEATAVYHRHKDEFAVENPFGETGLFARMTALAKLDRQVSKLLGRADKRIEEWVRGNIAVIADDEAGAPIDPAFTGDIETRHPNGNVFEQAAVRRGQLTGPYRRHFEDGTLEHESFYKGGRVTADYWPTGQPKRKKTKRGKLTVSEWFYPSGHLRKRFVAGPDGEAVEPVRLWHDNGQLAEELHVQAGQRFGPWLRFFEDGSPRLQAEYGPDEELVVSNAWDDNRCQVVTAGRGVFYDDGRDINASFSLVYEFGHTHSTELKAGVPHGVRTTWNDGVLRSRDEYVNGRSQGVHTRYYDNGRVQTRVTIRRGKPPVTEEFPKFDDPRPAVLLSVRADAKTYEAWGHPPLDEYPAPHNLEQVRRRFKVPAFLEDVFERNKAGRVKEDYDDLTTFDDTIVYMVMVDEKGAVDTVKFSGASAYSIAVLDACPPLIRGLKFTPGRRQGRKVRCQVAVSVHHTFADAAG